MGSEEDTFTLSKVEAWVDTMQGSGLTFRFYLFVHVHSLVHLSVYLHFPLVGNASGKTNRGSDIQSNFVRKRANDTRDVGDSRRMHPKYGK